MQLPLKRFGRPATLAIALCGFAGSAMAQSAIIIAPSAPPAPRIETVPPPPQQSLTWLPGRWTWTGSGWAWTDGRYVASPQPMARWEPGHWAPQPGRGYAWVEGNWRS